MLGGQSVSGANCAWGQSMCEPFSKVPFLKVLYHNMPNYRVLFDWIASVQENLIHLVFEFDKTLRQI